MNIKVTKISDKAVLPKRSHPSDAGFDLFSTVDCVIPSGGFVTVPLGIAIELPLGYEAQVRGRSGLASKHGIFCVTGVGTVDSGYRGEIKAVLGNFGTEDFCIYKGDRVSQLVVCKLPDVNLEEVVELGIGDRGQNGFGSTGL